MANFWEHLKARTNILTGTNDSNEADLITGTFNVAGDKKGLDVNSISFPGLNIPVHDEIVLSYTGSNLTGVVYKLATVTVATLTLAYTGSQLDSVVKS